MKTLFGIVVVSLMMVALTFAAPETGGISPRDVAGKPNVFCKVISEPDPLLLGGWKAVHRRYNMRLHKYVEEPVAYWLVKHGDRYGLYFYREKPGDKTHRGWRECTINGGLITSKTGFRISVQKGEVFYHWEGDQPTRMSRIEGN